MKISIHHKWDIISQHGCHFVGFVSYLFVSAQTKQALSPNQTFVVYKLLYGSTSKGKNSTIMMLCSWPRDSKLEVTQIGELCDG
jgi:hypothetical protein